MPTTTSSVGNINSWEEWKKADDAQKAASSGSLGMNDFYKLLASQLQNQDMNNPMENSEMMSQMSQMSMMQAVSDMSTAISDLSISNKTSYAASMIGKQGTFLTEVKEDGSVSKVSGTITSVDLFNFTFFLNGDTKTAYPMSYLMSLNNGEVQSPDEGPGGGGDGPGGEGTGPVDPDAGPGGPDAAE